MINIPGVLTIRIVAGRYGDFRVGRLITGIGEFAVKDQQLDQYLEGSYEGVSAAYPQPVTLPEDALSLKCVPRSKPLR